LPEENVVTVGWVSLSIRVLDQIFFVPLRDLNQVLGHKIRLAIAVEYLHKGSSIGQVVDLFRSQVDFNEEKSRYFVEDAKRKKYKPFRCRTIRELGFCLSSSCHYKGRRENGAYA